MTDCKEDIDYETLFTELKAAATEENDSPLAAIHEIQVLRETIRLNSEPADGDVLLELQQFLVDEIISMENLMLNARFAGDTFYENCYKHKKQALMIVDNKIDELASTRPTRQAGEWQDIETAPKDGSIVLVHYKNSHKKSRIVKAFYAARFAIESDVESDNDEYDEASDTYFIPEGWYELIDNWDDFSSIAIHQGVPDFWQPLPTPPRA